MVVFLLFAMVSCPYRRSSSLFLLATHIIALPVVSDIARMKECQLEEAEKEIRTIMDRVQFSFAELGVA